MIIKASEKTRVGTFHYNSVTSYARRKERVQHRQRDQGKPLVVWSAKSRTGTGNRGSHL